MSRLLFVPLIVFAVADRAVAAEGHTDTAAPSPSTAFALSLGSTVGGVGAGLGLWFAAGGADADASNLHWAGALLAMGGQVVGPSIGHYYAGEARHASLFTGLRAGLTFLSFFGAMGYAFSNWSLCLKDCDTESQSQNESSGGGWLVLASVAGASSVALSVYDIIDAPRAARRAKKSSTLSILPFAASQGGGIAMAGVF